MNTVNSPNHLSEYCNMKILVHLNETEFIPFKLVELKLNWPQSKSLSMTYFTISKCFLPQQVKSANVRNPSKRFSHECAALTVHVEWARIKDEETSWTKKDVHGIDGAMSVLCKAPLLFECSPWFLNRLVFELTSFFFQLTYTVYSFKQQHV